MEDPTLSVSVGSYTGPVDGVAPGLTVAKLRAAIEALNRLDAESAAMPRFIWTAHGVEKLSHLMGVPSGGAVKSKGPRGRKRALCRYLRG